LCRRIAYLTGQYPRATDTFIQREIVALRRQKMEVTPFSVRRPSASEQVGGEREAEQTRTIYLLPVSPLKLMRAHARMLWRSPRRYAGALRLAWHTHAAGLRGMLYQLFYFAEAGLLADHLEKRDIDHLHNHFANSSCTVSMLSSQMSGIPFSFTLHGPAIFFEPKRWRLDEKLRRAAFVACISHFCRSQAMCFCEPEYWPKLHIVHCGIDPDAYKPVTHRGPAQRLLCIGRLSPEKGLPILLRAFACLRRERPWLELTLVGDGPSRAELAAEVERRGLTEAVTFAGYQPPDEVARWLAESDVLISSSFAEGVPVALMEALASQVPVVATRIAGVPELVKDGETGYLTAPGDPNSLATHLALLLDNPDRRQTIGETGRARIRSMFDVNHEASRLRHLLMHHQREPALSAADFQERDSFRTNPEAFKA
jgi:glycosyltransferase involved in cell wall biosynthesis